MLYRLLFALIGSLAIISAIPTHGLAQSSTGRLQGAVLDSEGSPVPGCRVIAVHKVTQARTEVAVDDGGLYLFLALGPGEYSVSAQAPGFRTEVREAVLLNPGTTVSEQFRLEASASPETVGTKSVGGALQSHDAQIAGYVSTRELEMLPQLERRPVELAAYQPGVQIEGGRESFSSVNGMRRTGNNLRVDGLDANDPIAPRLGFSAVAVNGDSVDWFRVVTSGAEAEFGRSAGAQIQLVSRSGGNRWSGNVFEYLRNKAFNANDFFNNSSDVGQPDFSQHLFGGSFGGPVQPGKTFVFANYQGRITAQDAVRNRTVLTDEAKQGIFRWYTPGTENLQSYDIAKNDRRRLGINSQVASLLAKLPEYNNTDIGDELNTAGHRFNSPIDSDDHQGTFRLDHNLTAKHQLFYRLSYDRNTWIDHLNGNDRRFPSEQEGTEEERGFANALGSNWTISPTLANQFRFGVRQASISSLRPARTSDAMLLSNTWTDPLNPAFGREREYLLYEAADHATWQRGRHTIKAGVEFRSTKLESSSDAGIYSNITFARANGNTPPGNVGPVGSSVITSADRQRFENIYNDLLGRVDQITRTFYSDLEEFQDGGTPRARNFGSREYAFFLQDGWRIAPNLTLTLGLRYDYSGVPDERDGLQATLDQASLIDAAAHISDFEIERSSKWYERDYNNFAPRFGFAWDPRNNGRMVIRGSYGMFYNRLTGATTNMVDSYTPGFSQTVTAYPNSGGADVRLSDTLPVLSVPSAPDLDPPATRSSSIAVLNPGLRTGYFHHFSLTVQRELLRHTVIEAGYVGTRGVKLFTQTNLNQPRIEDSFLKAFQELHAFRANGTPISSTNTLVRMFGSASAAISAIGGSTIDQGLAGTAADTIDRNYFDRYRAAGLSSYYLRNFPQFDQLIYGSNNGRSYFDSLQVHVRRRTGAFTFQANYAWSKSLDNLSTEGETFVSPIDNFNLDLNKGRSDFNRPHVFSSSMIFPLPLGKGHWFMGGAPPWMNALIGGWEAGLLLVFESGKPFSVSSGRRTAGANVDSWADYTGNRTIGRVDRRTDGVFYFTAGEIAGFGFPAAGTIGTSGRNSFLGPRYFNADLALVKHFRVRETSRISLRAEIYNVLNHANFVLPETNLVNSSTFGEISAMQGAPRQMQFALRYEF